jgi:hypothetical protein
MGFLLLVGCSTAGPPPWISHVPFSNQEICAVGISGPTFYPEDARAHSTSLAMAELARAWEVKVNAHLLLRSEGDSRSSDTQLRETAAFEATDVMLKGATVREQWLYDGSDHRYGETGTAYTLVCVPTKR